MGLPGQCQAPFRQARGYKDGTCAAPHLRLCCAGAVVLWNWNERARPMPDPGRSALGDVLAGLVEKGRGDIHPSL